MRRLCSWFVAVGLWVHTLESFSPSIELHRYYATGSFRYTSESFSLAQWAKLARIDLRGGEVAQSIDVELEEFLYRVPTFSKNFRQIS